MTFNLYLRNTIGFSTNARVNSIRNHGLDDFDVLEEFEDEDVKTMMIGARKDPNTPMVISAIIEKRVRLACYAARIYTMIGRTVDQQSLSLNRLRVFEQHKNVLKEQKDSNVECPKVSKTFGIGKALDMLPNYLRSKIGVRGVALSYVIRADENAPTLEPLHTNVPYAEGASSLMTELINHVPHSGIGWDEDNSTVFGILQEMVKDSPMSSSLKTHQRSRNGRGAYNSLVQHNLGSAQWDKILEKAEGIQTTRIWNGRNSRYPLKRHIETHRDSYNDMVRAQDHVQYEVPNERTRVGRLLKSVQADYMASVAAAKTTIEASNTMRENFEEAADFLVLNAPVPKPSQTSHRISSVYGNDADGDYDDEKTLDDFAHVHVADRFYSKAKYDQLSNDQKHKLRLLRLDRGGGSGRRKGGDNGNGKGNTSRTRKRNQMRKRKVQKLKSENDEFKQRIAALESKEDDKDDSVAPENQPPTKKVKFNQR